MDDFYKYNRNVVVGEILVSILLFYLGSIADQEMETLFFTFGGLITGQALYFIFYAWRLHV